MEKNNSIINSLKRLERIGSETSRVIQKLKKSVIIVAQKLEDIIIPIRSGGNIECITKKLYIVNNKLCIDIDEQLLIDNCEKYQLNPDNGNVNRTIALYFANAIASGLIDDIINWIQRRKNEIDYVKKIIEIEIEKI